MMSFEFLKPYRHFRWYFYITTPASALGLILGSQYVSQYESQSLTYLTVLIKVLTTDKFEIVLWTELIATKEFISVTEFSFKQPYADLQCGCKCMRSLRTETLP